MTKILVVDDNGDICNMVQTLLSIDGYRVITCVNPMIVREMIRKEKPDLLITDMLMSGVDGRTLIRELREDEETKNLKIIMMSAHPAALRHSEESGSDDFIAKPFDYADLNAKVRALTEKLSAQ